jgi:hypothetical protein
LPVFNSDKRIHKADDGRILLGYYVLREEIDRTTAPPALDG